MDAKETFLIGLGEIQPSQLYVSSAKLAKVTEEGWPRATEDVDPLPVRRFGPRIVLTDGHTRALAAYLSGISEIRAFWDEDDMDWEAYEICIGWCAGEGIRTIADLGDRLIGPEEYEALWYRRCRELLEELKRRRG